MYQIRYTLDMSDKPLLTIKFFKTLANNEPVREWLKAQIPADRKAIGEDIKTVQSPQNGDFHTAGQWECRL